MISGINEAVVDKIELCCCKLTGLGAGKVQVGEGYLKSEHEGKLRHSCPVSLRRGLASTKRRASS